ncbi:MAG: hypothetical protein K8R13_02970 [Methanococcoides sp.]|nr:hypothetical protein [Methanococcoides sp.]
MKILYDTNILIHIQDPKVLSPNLQLLLSIIREHGHQEFIHPASLNDIENDSDIERKRITLSKLHGYPRLPSPPKPDDEFISLVGTPANSHDINDNEILFSLKKNLVDFLITEDRGIRKKANLLNLDDRVFSIDSALDHFTTLYRRFYPSHSLLRKCYVHEIDINQPFFDSLKSDYGDADFNTWYNKCIKESRECYTYEVEDKVNTYDFDFNVWVHVAVLKTVKSIYPFYLQHVLNSFHCYKQSQKYTHGVGNQDLGLTRMILITLPICSIEEQQTIVTEIETRLSVCDKVEQDIEENLEKAEALRQSILKKAFEGKLLSKRELEEVRSEPDWEPAEVLLGRIRAEKTNKK